MRDEFGEEDEQEEDESTSAATDGPQLDYNASLSQTVQNEKAKQLTREIKMMKLRYEELKCKMQKKVEEGTLLVGEKLFQECWEFFCLKAYSVSDPI